MHYKFIKDNSGNFDVGEMCECLGTARSAYYSWLRRSQGARARQDEVFKERIKQVYELANRRYGYRPIHQHLKDENVDCGRDRTLRLMKEMGISGIQSKSFKPQVTDSNHDFGYSPNLLKTYGKPVGINQVWVADTTYLKINEGWSYLATVMDLYSRRIIGWSVSSHNDSALVSEALQGAIWNRGGEIPKGLIHHSDRGSTYASSSYQKLLGRYLIESSMSAKGNCYDNAAMESFYGRYKTASVRKQVFAGEDQARRNAFEYIELFYNRFRKHSSLGYKNPVQFEKQILPPAGGNPPSLMACRESNTNLNYQNN